MLVADWMEPGQRQISPWNTILYVHTPGWGPLFIYWLMLHKSFFLSVWRFILFTTLSLVRSFFSLPFMWLYNYMRALVDIPRQKKFSLPFHKMLYEERSHIFFFPSFNIIIVVKGSCKKKAKIWRWFAMAGTEFSPGFGLLISLFSSWQWPLRDVCCVDLRYWGKKKKRTCFWEKRKFNEWTNF